ncbi:MAG: AAA family ATPase [Verrucomicrobiae bacterium]|nr:AAA family ATPase [Verrucomicrobiae bacterium]
MKLKDIDRSAGDGGIRKLKLTNFKNFRQAEISFGPVSILVGANATGKSNVRDALRFLHGIARGYNLAEIIGEKYGEGGQLQWSGIRGGTREVCFGSENAFSVGVEINHKGRGEILGTWYSYEITVQCGANGSAPRVVKERLYNGDSIIFDSHPQYEVPGQDDPMHLAVWLEKERPRRRKGPILTGISSQPILTQALELAERQKATSKIKSGVEAVLEALESIRFIDFSPDLMRKPSIPGQVILSDRGDNLSSVLQAICEKPELKTALSNWVQELTPMDVADFEFVPDAAGKILVYLVEYGGHRTSANSASDGTLRFLGMLAALLGPKPARFYFLEEIDNGIHPARLALLMEMLDHQSRSKGIQVVASTHSPQVLRLIKPGNLKYATLAYRLKGHSEGRLKPLPDIPNLMEVIQNKDIARLHESSWMEQTMEFSEGTPREFPIDTEEGGQ